jgi:methionyl-tRNA formyltransferase
MKIALLAQGPIAKSCVKILNNFSSKNLSVLFCVTNKIFFDEEIVKISKRIKFIDNNSRNEDLILSSIVYHQIDAIISIQHPWILSNKIINAVKKQAFNLHNAKLPDYKGHNSISHAILNSEKIYTTTIHKLAPKVDMGDIIFENFIEIYPDDTAYSLYLKTILPATKIFNKLIEHLIMGCKLPQKKIKKEGKFYSKKGLNILKEISVNDNFEKVNRKIRAFYFPPHEPAFIRMKDFKIYPQIDIKNYYK